MDIFQPGVAGDAQGDGLQAIAGAEHDKLKRALKLWDLVAVTIGTIIGSGIFASANRVLKQAGSVGHMLMVWICSGVLVTLGALVRRFIVTVASRSSDAV